jgi:hypothetical protein
MASRNTTSDYKSASERVWVEGLEELRTKVGEGEIIVEYLFPAGYLFATGFQLEKNERKIRILLQRQSPSGSASAFLELFLPAEETARYRVMRSLEGELYLSVTYPYCSHNRLPNVPLAEIRISTSAALLSFAASESLVH